MKTIYLTQGLFAVVDDEDFEAANQFRWYAVKEGRVYYAARMIRVGEKRAVLKLHSFLYPGVSQIDHRDGNGLNNRRGNLRPATNTQNRQGRQHKCLGASSRFRGVSKKTTTGRWEASIHVKNKKIHIGYYAEEGDAALAYDAAARKYFGEFASPNFP